MHESFRTSERVDRAVLTEARKADRNMVCRRREWWDGGKCAFTFQVAEKFGEHHWALTRMPASRESHVVYYATTNRGAQDIL